MSGVLDVGALYSAGLASLLCASLAIAGLQLMRQGRYISHRHASSAWLAATAGCMECAGRWLGVVYRGVADKY